MGSFKRFLEYEYKRGEAVPWYKGFVASCIARDSNYVAPIPFNLLISLVLYVYWSLRTGLQQHFMFEQRKGGKDER